MNHRKPGQRSLLAGKPQQPAQPPLTIAGPLDGQYGPILQTQYGLHVKDGANERLRFADTPTLLQIFQGIQQEVALG